MKHFQVMTNAPDDEGQPLLGLMMALPLSLLAWAAIGGIIHAFL